MPPLTWLRTALAGRPVPGHGIHDPLAGVLAALRHAGLSAADLQAVQATPAMAQQLRQFADAGGRIEHVVAGFDGANGMPGLIRFYSPQPGRASAQATYGALAHELGHALFCPDQWRPPEAFDSAHAYARSRELGEAHAWLNQYRLSRTKQGGTPEPSPVLQIENDADFGTQAVDMFARIGERMAAGWSEAQLLDELAQLNANMFPCGMGEGNHKTYGQCNRWDWLQATAPQHPAFNTFLQQLGRPPNAADQKLVTKFNLFTPVPPTDEDVAHAEDARAAVSAPTADDQVRCLAEALAAQHQRPGLGELFALGTALLPDCALGVACVRQTRHAGGAPVHGAAASV